MNNRSKISNDQRKELEQWKEVKTNRDLYIAALKSLTEQEICVFYYAYYKPGYQNIDIAKLCWPERDKPVTESSVAIIRTRIRQKFEQIFYGRNDNDNE